MILARYLGTEGFGYYSYVMAFVWTFQLIADLGLSNILVREVALNREKAPLYFGASKSLVWVLSILTYFVIALGINLFSSNSKVIMATYIAGLAVVPMFQTAVYVAVFRAYERMELNALGFVSHKVFLLGLILIGLKLKVGLFGLFGLLCGANLYLLLFYSVMLRRLFFKPQLLFHLQLWWSLLREAFPLGIASILRKVTWQVDALILAGLSTATSIGIYSAASKVTAMFDVLPLIIALPLFPVMARLAKNSPEEFAELAEGCLKGLCVFSLPFILLISFSSDKIILLLYGSEYRSSIAALQVLAWAVLFLFPTSFYIYLLTAMGKQRLYTLCSFACLGIKILLELVLVVHYDYLGACFGTLIAEFSLFAIGLYFLKIAVPQISISNITLKPVLCGLGLALLFHVFKAYWPQPLLLEVVIALSLYPLMLIGLRVFTPREIAVLKESLLFHKALVRASAPESSQE